MIEKSYLLRHIYIPITHKNFIVEDTRILQIQYFFPKNKYILRIFFKVKQTSKLIIVSICFGQVGISSGKQAFDITCPTNKLIKKLIPTPVVSSEVAKKIKISYESPSVL